MNDEVNAAFTSSFIVPTSSFDSCARSLRRSRLSDRGLKLLVHIVPFAQAHEGKEILLAPLAPVV